MIFHFYYNVSFQSHILWKTEHTFLNKKINVFFWWDVSFIFSIFQVVKTFFRFFMDQFLCLGKYSLFFAKKNENIKNIFQNFSGAWGSTECGSMDVLFKGWIRFFLECAQTTFRMQSILLSGITFFVYLKRTSIDPHSVLAQAPEKFCNMFLVFSFFSAKNQEYFPKHKNWSIKKQKNVFTTGNIKNIKITSHKEKICIFWFKKVFYVFTIWNRKENL